MDPLRTPRARPGREGGRTFFSWTIQTKPWRRFLFSCFLSFASVAGELSSLESRLQKGPYLTPHRRPATHVPPQVPTPPHMDLGPRDVKRCSGQGSLHLGNRSEKCLLFKCSFGFRSAWMKQTGGTPSPSSSTVLQVSHHYSKVILYTLSVSQFSCSVVSYSSRPHGLQHARFPCPSPNPGAYSKACPLSW